MDQIKLTRGSYVWKAIRQGDPRVWLATEHSGGIKVNTYAFHDDDLEITIRRIIEED